MGLRDLLKRDNSRAVVRYEPAMTPGPPIEVTGRTVVLRRPGLLLDGEGNTLPGVHRDLACNYLVATLQEMVGQQARGVEVEFVGHEGRFASARFRVPAWGVEVDICQPVAVVDQSIGRAFDTYRAGMALKVREMHKGVQCYDEANAQIRMALGMWRRLRQRDRILYTDAEDLFVQTALVNALTLSALAPAPEHPTAKLW